MGATLPLCNPKLTFYIIISCLGYRITEQSGKQFLAWQTWDLMWLMFYGFKNFGKEFIAIHPGYTIYPVRLNWNAVETFFSQVKHATSGHLSAVNYASARAAEEMSTASSDDTVETTGMH